MLLPLIVVALAEAAGLTQLFQRQQLISGPGSSGSDVSVPRKNQPEPASEGWVQLFNGKDLSGWKVHPDLRGHWEVKDGVLVGSRSQGFLFTERGDYQNFHLRAEAKINLGGDSGIFFHAGYGILRGGKSWQFGPAGGYEVELHKNRNHTRPTGSVAEVPGDAPPDLLGPPADGSLTEPDQWFTMEIIVNQNRFITKVNGLETADCTDPLDRHPRGHVGLQVWDRNTVVRFRKIEIKELPASTPPAEGTPVPDTKAKS
ncbi:MAG: DUF1080 domain-containing protein [Gemmataceae bacterium]|nr:DUF1080 domain-containing protein [Gemmataceae bacterium]